jgi:hypothetical protein
MSEHFSKCPKDLSQNLTIGLNLKFPAKTLPLNLEHATFRTPATLSDKSYPPTALINTDKFITSFIFKSKIL